MARLTRFPQRPNSTHTSGFRWPVKGERRRPTRRSPTPSEPQLSLWARLRSRHKPIVLVNVVVSQAAEGQPIVGIDGDGLIEVVDAFANPSLESLLV